MERQFYKEELGKMIAKNSELKSKILKLTIENAEMKDKLISSGDEEFNVFDELEKLTIYESPDGGKTIYSRRAGDYDNKELINNPDQLQLFK